MSIRNKNQNSLLVISIEHFGTLMVPHKVRSTIHQEVYFYKFKNTHRKPVSQVSDDILLFTM